MIINFVIFILVALYALNMGLGNYATSFASAHGSGIISTKKSQLLFIFFVSIGAITLGDKVSGTLSGKIIPSELINNQTVAIILFSATFCLFIANTIRLPQSTSLVAVGAILGVGFYYNNFYLKNFLYLIPCWILFPILGYFLTYFCCALIYPSRSTNFWVYEKSARYKKILENFVIISSCYNAFSIGSNNVANAVGPLVGGNITNAAFGLLLVSPIFGLGSIVFPSIIHKTGKEIIPIGLISASITCLVCGTLMIIASCMGIPQSLVMIKVAAITAVSSIKDGHQMTFNNMLLRKMYLTWIIMPFVAIIISFLLTALVSRITLNYGIIE